MSIQNNPQGNNVAKALKRAGGSELKPFDPEAWKQAEQVGDEARPQKRPFAPSELPPVLNFDPGNVQIPSFDPETVQLPPVGKKPFDPRSVEARTMGHGVDDGHQAPDLGRKPEAPEENRQLPRRPEPMFRTMGFGVDDGNQLPDLGRKLPAPVFTTQAFGVDDGNQLPDLRKKPEEPKEPEERRQLPRRPEPVFRTMAHGEDDGHQPMQIR